MIVSLKEKLRQFTSQLSYFPQTLNLIWLANKKLTLCWAVLLILQGLIPGGTVWITRLLVDSLAVTIGAGATADNIRSVAVCAIFMGSLLLFGNILQGAMGWVRSAQSEQTADYLSGRIHSKLASVDMAFYETPEELDRLYQACNDLKSRPLVLLESMGGGIQSGLTLVIMGAILVPYGIWLPILLLLSTLPAFVVLLRTNKQFHDWWLQSTQDRRWADYYDTVLRHDMFAAELRLFELGPHFKKAFQHTRRNLREDRLGLIKRQSFSRFWAEGFSLIIASGAMAWMVWRAFLGQVTLGDLALFYQIFNKGRGLLSGLLANIGSVYNNSLFINKLHEFLDSEPTVTDPKSPSIAPARLRKGIGFNHVTFRYPGSRKTALKNFNCWFPAGKIIAIVGTNGAGKTTLMKLLCRFYDPESGCIQFDGHDIKTFTVKELRRMITAIFQFPLMHVASASDNIAIGDLRRKSSQADIESSAKKAGADEFIRKLPEGYDTLLNKYFPKGVNLSGGEQQRLSLARAYIRKSPVIVLDEPTSMMDSWGLKSWFERFRELASGKTAILITHSLPTARNADLIYVMDGGQVVETGTHEELISKKGRYAASWNAQFGWRPEQLNSGKKPSAIGLTARYQDHSIDDVFRKVS